MSYAISLGPSNIDAMFWRKALKRDTDLPLVAGPVVILDADESMPYLLPGAAAFSYRKDDVPRASGGTVLSVLFSTS